MSLPSNGYIEINDTNSKIRGMMAGAGGTFSGSFSSMNVDAVENVNIRDGAVNAFYGFSFPRGSKSISFTVPHQPFARVMEIMVPVEVYESGLVWGYGNESIGGVITVYKNGVLYKQEYILPNIGLKLGTNIPGGGAIEYLYVWYLQTARIMDFEVTGVATYTITFLSWGNKYPINGNGLHLTFQGQVTVGFRKR